MLIKRPHDTIFRPIPKAEVEHRQLHSFWIECLCTMSQVQYPPNSASQTTSLPKQICFVTNCVKWQFIYPNLLGKHCIPPLPHSTAWFQCVLLSPFARTSVTSKKDHKKLWYSAGLREEKSLRVVGYCLTTSRGLLQEAEQKFTFVSRSDQGNFFTNHSYLLSLPTLSPASHVVSTSSAAPSAKSESWDLNWEGSTQQEYLSQSHFFHFFIHGNSITYYFCKSKFTSQD